MSKKYLVTLRVGSRFLIDRKSIRRTVEESFVRQGIESAWVDVSIVGQRKMKSLNALRQKDGPTNVLSFTQRDPTAGEFFPTPEGEVPHYGDIVLCYPVLVKEAVKRNKLVDDLINYYLDHSIHHLVGKHFSND